MCRPKHISLSEAEIKNEFYVRKEIVKPRKKTFFVVGSNHNAIFLKDGSYTVLFEGEYPAINKGEKKVGKVEVIYLSKTHKIEVRWGTPNKFEMRDITTDALVKVGLRGVLQVQMNDPRKVYLEVIDSSKEFNIEQLKIRLRNRICGEIQPIIAKVMEDRGLTFEQMAERSAEVATFVEPVIADMFRRNYGFNLSSFAIDAIMIEHK